jgi:hypothetical protein
MDPTCQPMYLFSLFSLTFPHLAHVVARHTVCLRPDNAEAWERCGCGLIALWKPAAHDAAGFGAACAVDGQPRLPWWGKVPLERRERWLAAQGPPAGTGTPSARWVGW